MSQGHIYIYGDIENYQGGSASEYGIVSLSTVVNAINENKDASELIVHINSRGGDVSEGFAIHDALVSSGKQITTSIEGICASIATVISLAGSKRTITPNSEVMIHNPWGFSGGDAEVLQKYTDQVKAYEEKILNFYVEKTGADKDLIKSMMDNETYFNADKALELKFITEIEEKVKAFAKINTTNNMSEQKSFLETLKQEVKNMFGELTKTINASGHEIKASTKLATKAGVELVIDGEVAVDEKVMIGDKVAENGSYEMNDGTILVVAEGKISEIKIKETVPPTDSSAELKAANEQVADLTAKLEAQIAENVQAKADAEIIKAQVAEMTKLTSKYKVKGAVIVTSETSPATQKTKEEKLAELRKAYEQK